MTKLLLIDCKTLLVARYDGRKQDEQLALIEVPFDSVPAAIAMLDEFRVHGAGAVLPTVRA